MPSPESRCAAGVYFPYGRGLLFSSLSTRLKVKFQEEGCRPPGAVEVPYDSGRRVGGARMNGGIRLGLSLPVFLGSLIAMFVGTFTGLLGIWLYLA